MRKLMWLLLLLWLVSFSFTGALVSDLYEQVGILEVSNDILTTRLIELQSRVDQAAPKDELAAVASDLALLRQQYQEASGWSSDPQMGQAIVTPFPGAPSPPVGSDEAEFGKDHAAPVGKTTPWHIADRVAFYGSQLARAVVDALKLRPVIP